MSATLLMLQGTGSSVGKSALVAGLCRLFFRRGVKVAPFKAQNMALNSFITPSGAEIGRAQAVQAEACGLSPEADMNPVLIKPNSDTGAQVIIHGKPIGNMSAAVYHDYKETAWQAVSSSLERLRRQYELIIIEGAGSPAEINLRDKDIVNMGLATRVDAPVLLIGDIDKGGVFASLVGTMELLNESERALIKGFIINKFRGDSELLRPGLETISARCGVPFVGVVPWFGREIYLPEEDGVALENDGQSEELHEAECRGYELRIGVIKLSHISNFTDFDPLSQAPGVRLEYLEPDALLTGYDLLILPGSKNTIADLSRLQALDLPRRLVAFAEAGGAIVGICGGYQMLGESLSDPQMIESGKGSISGIGLLPVKTEMEPEKVTIQCRAQVSSQIFGAGLKVHGYEIHQGRTTAANGAQPLLQVAEAGGGTHFDGTVTLAGRIWGTYMHGIFDDDSFRNAYLNWLREHRSGGSRSQFGEVFGGSYRERKEEGLNHLADLLLNSLDMTMVDRLAGL